MWLISNNSQLFDHYPHHSLYRFVDFIGWIRSFVVSERWTSRGACSWISSRSIPFIKVITMRTIKLFQWWPRRSCALQGTITPTYRITVVGMDTMLDIIRKQLYCELFALGVPISNVHVYPADTEALSCTSITLEWDPHLLPTLNTLVIRLGKSPDVCRVHLEDTTNTRRVLMSI